MTFDPYTNRIPHGLLTDEEKAALVATGGPWEYCTPLAFVWHPSPTPRWYTDCTYRAVRKSLPVPQEGDVWFRTDPPHRNWFAAEPNDPEAGSIIAEGYRLFREVKADD
jgi:hypothetical protein